MATTRLSFSDFQLLTGDFSFFFFFFLLCCMLKRSNQSRQSAAGRRRPLVMYSQSKLLGSVPFPFGPQPRHKYPGAARRRRGWLPVTAVQPSRGYISLDHCLFSLLRAACPCRARRWGPGRLPATAAGRHRPWGAGCRSGEASDGVAWGNPISNDCCCLCRVGPLTEQKGLGTLGWAERRVCREPETPTSSGTLQSQQPQVPSLPQPLFVSTETTSVCISPPQAPCATVFIGLSISPCPFSVLRE